MKGLPDAFRFPKEVFLNLTFFGIIALAFKDSLNFRYKNKYILFFISWVFITFIFNWYLPLTFPINGKSLINLWTIQPMITFTLALFASHICMSSLMKDDYIRIAKAICLSAMLLCAFGYMQVLGLCPTGGIFNYAGNKFLGFLDNANVSGAYLALSIPLFLYFVEKKEKKYILGVLLVLTGLILTKSKISILAGVIGIFTYIILAYKKWVRITAIVMLVLFIFTAAFFVQQSFIKDGFDGRWECWKLAYEQFKNNPLFGQGLGIVKTWEMVPDSVTRTIWVYLHNDYFEIAVQFGILGLFLVLLILINTFRNFNYKSDSKINFAYMGSFVVFLILMVGSFPLEIAPLALLGLVNFWAVETL